LKEKKKIFKAKARGSDLKKLIETDQIMGYKFKTFNPNV